MFKSFSQISEQAYLIDYGNTIDIETNNRVINHFKYLQNLNYKYILNVVPSFNKLLIQFNPTYKKNILKLLRKIKSTKYNFLNTVKKHNIETLPTAYLIVGDGGTTGFIGRAKGIPPNKPKLAAMYALAAQYLGMRFLYLEGGSGVISHVPLNVIKAVRKAYDGFLIVGGGIKNAKIAQSIIKCGVNAIVIGTLTESKNYELNLKKITKTLK